MVTGYNSARADCAQPQMDKTLAQKIKARKIARLNSSLDFD
jgi:hypothetical protein